jgi:hypothetical protein
MELRAASGQVNIAQLISARTNSGRINIPVSRAQSPYAQFKYVQGVPASSKGHAVPVNRLRILNNLIDSLVQLKESNTIQPKVSHLSDEAIDAMITQYAGKLHDAVSTPSIPYSPGLGYSTGSLVNLTA